MLGLITELGSRPRADPEGPEGGPKFRYWQHDPLRSTYRVDETIAKIEAQAAARVSSRALGLASVAVTPIDNKAEQAAAVAALEPISAALLTQLAEYTRLRRWNYQRRMLPHVIGIFTYLFAWVPILNHFFQQLEDLRREDEDLFERVPDFVPWAVLGSFLIFTTFTFVQWRYQFISPGAHTLTFARAYRFDTAPPNRLLLEDGAVVRDPLAHVQALPRRADVQQRAGAGLVCGRDDRRGRRRRLSAESAPEKCRRWSV
jgi:hypothetical protein